MMDDMIETTRARAVEDAAAAAPVAPPDAPEDGALRWCSCKASARGFDQHMAWCDRAQVAYPPNVAPPANWKENNPKDGFGILKACMSWVPEAVIMELAVAMAEGGYKYGGHNYLVAAPRSSVYTDAARRHIFQYETLGEEVDVESGLSHITKAIASLAVLRAAQINQNFIDDRPPPAPAGFLTDLNDKMKTLSEKHTEPVARYLAGGRRGPGRVLP